MSEYMNDPSLTKEDKTWAGLYFDRLAKRDFERGEDVYLSIVRRLHPRTFAFLCRTNEHVAGIAVRHGWHRDFEPRHERTEEEITHVQRVVAEAVALTTKRPSATQSASALDAARAEVGAMYERSLGNGMSEEQVRALRDADPGVQKARGYQKINRERAAQQEGTGP